MLSGLLLGIVLSVCTCWFYNMVTLPTRLVSTDFVTCTSGADPDFVRPEAYTVLEALFMKTDTKLRLQN